MKRCACATASPPIRDITAQQVPEHEPREEAASRCHDQGNIHGYTLTRVVRRSKQLSANVKNTFTPGLEPRFFSDRRQMLVVTGQGREVKI